MKWPLSWKPQQSAQSPKKHDSSPVCTAAVALKDLYRVVKIHIDRLRTFIGLQLCGEMQEGPWKRAGAVSVVMTAAPQSWMTMGGGQRLAQSSCLLWVLKACLWRWASISSRNTSMPRWEWEASFMALDWMHMRYCSGVSSSAHCFSCHRWKRLDTGVRITIRSLRRYFLYRWTSSTPQPLTSRSNPPAGLGEIRSASVFSGLNVKMADRETAYQYLGNLSDTDKSSQSQSLSRSQHLFCESMFKKQQNPQNLRTLQEFCRFTSYLHLIT